MAFDSTYNHPADQLGALRAQIADLKAREAALIETLKAEGLGVHEGSAYRATVCEVQGRTALDLAAAEAKLRELGVHTNWFRAHQKVTVGHVAVRVAARKG